MNEAKALYLRITGLGVTTIEPLYGGLNSANYLINRHDVLRIKKPSFDTFYHPINEFKAEKLVATTGLTPKLLHFNQISGNKLTSFLPDTTFISKPPTKKQVQSVAQALKQLHALPNGDIAPFDAIKRYALYKKTANILTSGPNEEKIIAYIQHLFTQSPAVFCHNDLVSGNILFKDDNIYIIDYEYAGLNHYLFDLASFISENNINDAALIDSFLATYFQEKNIPRRDFDIVCRFLDYLWYYWAQGMFNVTGQSIFKTIAKAKWQRLKNF
jgi:thiamine kinase-like enzyme